MSANEYTEELHKFLEFNARVSSGSHQYESLQDFFPNKFSIIWSHYLVTITFVNGKPLKKKNGYKESTISSLLRTTQFYGTSWFKGTRNHQR